MKLLRWLIGLASVCGLLGWGAMFLFIIGMSGFGAGRANLMVVATLTTPLIFFPLCILGVAGKFGARSLRLAMGTVVVLALPFLWYLGINGTGGVVCAGALLGFLLLWLVVCRQQLPHR